MKEKRNWAKVLSEVSNAHGKSEVSDELWQELLDLTKSCQSCHDVCWILDLPEKWREEFLDKMTQKIVRSSQWRLVVEISKADSKRWKEAIQKVYEATKEQNSLYYWQRFYYLLPKDHELLKESKDKVRDLRKKARK